MTAIIRSAVPDDADALAELHVRAWQSAYRGHMRDDFLDALDIEKRSAGWRRTLDRGDYGSIMVVERDGGVAGFCLFDASHDDDANDEKVGEIVAINIHPDHWRCSFGTLLCEHVLHEAAGRGWTSVTLWVIEGNVRARRFYEKLGFAADGRARTDATFAGGPLNEVRYRQQIHTPPNNAAP